MSTFPVIEPRPDPILIEPSTEIEIEPRIIDEDILPRVISSRDVEDIDIDGVLESTEEENRVKCVLNPVLFANYYLKTETWDTQQQIMEAVASHPKVAVKACHSSSKTFTSAILTLWFLARYTDCVVITTAPTHAQVEKLLWGEIHAAVQRSSYKFPPPNLTQLKMGAKRYAYGLSTVVTKQDEGVKFQGFHAKNVLVIIDEAPGVNAKIWEAIEGARAGGDVHILAIGNPTIPSGPFHSAFTNSRSGWRCFTIDAFDNPNFYNSKTGDRVSLEQLIKWGEESAAAEAVFKPSYPYEVYKHPHLDYNPIPYLANRRWVLEQFHEWGVEHPFWESRVRGQFPKQSEYSLLSLAWLEEQSRKPSGLGKGKVSAGLDVAGPGEAETSLTIRRGEEILVHKQWSISDPRGDIIMALEPYRGELDVVNVDAVAVGWYIYQHLLDLKFPAQPIIAQAQSSDSVKYADLKAEYYWSLRLQLSQGKFSGLTDEKTIGQLAGIRWKSNSRGQIEIESKEQAAKRGVKSPDRAESVMLAFGSKIQVYGAIEYFSKLQKEIEAGKATADPTRTNVLKSVLPDKQLVCPICSATCISMAQGDWRCGACGFQWNDKQKKDSLHMSRAEAMLLMSAKKRKF